MINPWVLNITGILFCLSGIVVFQKYIYEEGHSLKWPFFIIIMGVILIGFGTAALIFK